MLEQKRILIVEDEADMALVLQECLSDAGAIVLGIADTVSGAIDAIKGAIAGQGIDAVVLDLNLHGERAWPVADLLEQHGVPFVLQTGYISLMKEKDGQMAILEKPYDLDILLQVVAEICAAQPRRTAVA